MAAMVRWRSPFVEVLCCALHQKMEEIGGEFWRIEAGFRSPLMDPAAQLLGHRPMKRLTVPPTMERGRPPDIAKRKPKACGAKRIERTRPQPQEPQAWITMLWHMGLRLPWMWRLGPSNSSERSHVMDMLNAGRFPERTIFCGDAGFVGYPLWSHILNSGADFLVRVGANVSLLRARHYSVEKERRRALLA